MDGDQGTDAMLDLVPTDDQGTIGDDAQFLGALSVLEQETATLTEQAAEADEFPAWLAEAADALDSSVPAAMVGTRPPSPPYWDETMAIVQGACAQADATPNSADALEWLDQKIAATVADAFPQLERLVTSPSFTPASKLEAARELLRKRDLLALRQHHRSVFASMPIALHTLGAELRREEEFTHSLCAGVTKQLRSREALVNQLELTRNAAEATRLAARTIVDEHAHDVGVLTEALRRVSPDAAAAVEVKLSATQAQLAARKRRARAEQALAKKANSSFEGGGSGGGKVRAFSFVKRQHAREGDPAGTPKGSATEAGGLQSSPSDGRDATPIGAIRSAAGVAATEAAELAGTMMGEVKQIARSLSFSRSRNGRVAEGTPKAARDGASANGGGSGQLRARAFSFGRRNALRDQQESTKKAAEDETEEWVYE